MQEETQPGGDTILRGDTATPFVNGNALLVTPEEHLGITAFIRHLKPGVYIKCSKCLKMKYNQSGFFTDDTGLPVCERCL